jgi:hypothetical protein
MPPKTGERGTIVVMTAILIPILIFITGFAVDFGVMYAVRNAAQNAADAAAMAAVYAYSQSGDPGDPTVAIDPGNKASSANPIFGGASVTPISISAYRGAACTDSFGIENYCVKVTLKANSPVYFARVFGKTAVPIQVKATAQADTGFGFANDCAKPIFVPDPALLAPPVSVGGTLLIRPTNPSGALVPSNYYSLDFSSILNPNNPKPDPVVLSDDNGVTVDQNSGVPTYRDAWTKCTITAIRCGQVLNVQTGNFGNPTTTAVQQLVASGITTVVAPMWDPSSAAKSGNTFQAKVGGFVQLTNLHVSGGDVYGTYAKKLACGAGNGVGSGQSAYTSPVRLIQ